MKASEPALLLADQAASSIHRTVHSDAVPMVFELSSSWQPAQAMKEQSAVVVTRRHMQLCGGSGKSKYPPICNTHEKPIPPPALAHMLRAH